MRHQRFLTVFLSFAFCPASWGGLVLQPQSKLWLEGDSTLHRYASMATQISFFAEISSAGVKGELPGTEEAVKRGLVRGLRVMIPISGLKSGKSGLDENLRRALKSGEHPEISFSMAGYRLEGAFPQDRVTAWGALSVAGVEKDVALRASIQWRDGLAVIDGEHSLLMTDFGVKPPKLMLGALRTDDRVIIKFHLELGQSMGEPETIKGKEEL